MSLQVNWNNGLTFQKYWLSFLLFITGILCVFYIIRSNDDLFILNLYIKMNASINNRSFDTVDQGNGVLVQPNHSLMEKLTEGEWIPKEVSQSYEEAVEETLASLRRDKNIEMQTISARGGCGRLMGRKYTTICDPHGKYPCCFKGRCAKASIEDCKCDKCLDERTKIHPEFHTWTPYNITLHTFPPKDMCLMFHRLNISLFYSLGDSLSRGVCEGAWKIMEPLRTTPLDIRPQDQYGPDNYKCEDIFHLRGHRLYHTKLAGFEVCNTTNIYWSLSIKVEEGTPAEKAHLFELLNTTYPGDVVLLMNMALHIGLQLRKVQTFIKTILTHIQNTYTDRKFYIIFFPPYTPGLHKARRYKKQQKGPTMDFTINMKKYVMDNNVRLTYLNPQMLVKHLISYDGTHYTQGLNEAMFQIIMNYLNYSQM
ncbi:unnamed protein product [Owenia fusiformis]|uniref:Uncharacterized protein n=1 Tax=Owenia fusiformis TaxID=6347 RepID=A0A8S4NF18_OWEFU|nr:unnamed protein product [Owenia fusiformis]